jgi:hypothetical protein
MERGFFHAASSVRNLLMPGLNMKRDQGVFVVDDLPMIAYTLRSFEASAFATN